MSVVSNNSSKLSDKSELIKSSVTNLDETNFNVGDNVYIVSNPDKVGIVMYNGVTKFSDGIWIGIALEHPVGKHNGSVQGITYFHCEEKHGLFVRQTNLRHLKDKITNKTDINEGENQSSQINNNNLQNQPDSDKFIIPDSDLYNKSKLVLGEKVCVVRKTSTNAQKTGVLRFLGHTKFSEGFWAGIELDNPIGKNDGSVDGIRYFSCKPLYGLFALESKVEKYNPSNSRSARTTTRVDSISKFGSNESISSFVSNFSSASRTRVRLEITAIGSNGKLKPESKIRTNSSSTILKEQIQGSKAFQKVLKEKEQHVEQLIREREIERMDLATATAKIDELERQLSRQISNNADRSLRFENRIIELQQNIVSINEKNEKFTEKLEEEKKKIEDLLFQIEEKNIDKSDLEIKIQENEKHIIELSEKLAREKDLKESLEKTLLEFSKINKQDDTKMEDLQLKVLQLQKELLEDKQNSKIILEKSSQEVVALQKELTEDKLHYEEQIKLMTKVIEEKDSSLKDLQGRFDNLKSNFDDSLKEFRNLESLNNNFNEKTIKDHYENEICNLKMEIENAKINELNDKETIAKIKESCAEKILKAQSEIINLTKKIEFLNFECESHVMTCQSIKEENEKLQIDISLYLQKLGDLKLQLSKMTSENKKLSDKISEKIEINSQEALVVKDRVEVLEKENFALTERLNCSEEKYKNSCRSNEDLIKKISDFELKIEKLDIVLKLDKEKNCTLNAENAALQHELKLMKQEKIEIQSNLTKDIEELQSIVFNFEKEKTILMEKCETKIKQLSAANDQSAQLLSKKVNIFQESLEKNKEEYCREKQLLLDNISQLEDKLEKTDKKLKLSLKDEADLSNQPTIDTGKQIDFLHVVIANREEKLKSLELENEKLRNNIKDLEKINPPVKFKKILPPRLYCDVCEMFDSHDTKQCPVPVSDSPQSSPVIKVREAPRLYCDICEEFDLHNTNDCQDEQTY